VRVSSAVTVCARGSVVLTGGSLTIPRSTITDANGIYSIASISTSTTPPTQGENLEPQVTYTLTIRPGDVAAYTTSSPYEAPGMSDNNPSTDSNFVPFAFGTPSELFQDAFRATGLNDTTQDGGFVPELLLGDFVWIDYNGNGCVRASVRSVRVCDVLRRLQDAGEPGIAGVAIQLFPGNSNATSLATTTTAADGSYHFSSRNVTLVCWCTAVF
jgi:hypothetical protein